MVSLAVQNGQFGQKSQNYIPIVNERYFFSEIVQCLWMKNKLPLVELCQSFLRGFSTGNSHYYPRNSYKIREITSQLYKNCFGLINTFSWVLLLTGIVSGRNSMEVISSLLEGARWRKERSSPDDNPQPSLPLTKKIKRKYWKIMQTFF